MLAALGSTIISDLIVVSTCIILVIILVYTHVTLETAEAILLQ